MKQLLLFLSLFGFYSIQYAQNPQITNHSFENWTDQIIKSLQDFRDSGDENYGIIEQSTDAVHGQYSVKLQTTESYGELAAGYFVNFDPDNFTGGVAYSQHVDSICGYYKAHLIAQDSALFLAILKNNGNPVGGGLYKFAADRNTNNWTRFCYPTNMPAGVVSDTLMFGAASSNAIDEIGMENGSWIQFDSISLKSGNQLLPTMPNYSFENWDVRTISYPDDFDSSLKWDINSTPLPVEKVTDATDGNYAVKLNTVVKQQQDTIVGAITNGIIDDWPFSGGLALSQIPDAISWDYKVHYAGHIDFDPNVQFIFKLNGQEIGYFGRTYQSDVNVYQHENLPINLTNVPDTLQFNAFSGNFPGNWLIVDNIVIDYPAGITDNLNIQQMIAYPVPAKDRIHLRITAKQPEPVQISLFDINGREVWKNTYDLQEGKNLIDINISQLPPGTYLYRLKAKTGIVNKKFVKL